MPPRLRVLLWCLLPVLLLAGAYLFVAKRFGTPNVLRMASGFKDVLDREAQMMEMDRIEKEIQSFSDNPPGGYSGTALPPRLRPVAKVPKAGVRNGKPFAWRNIGAALSSMPAGIGVGNFDGDKDDEVLLSDFDKFRIVELDGSIADTPLSLGFTAEWVAWDCDRDGVKDVVAEETRPGKTIGSPNSQETNIYNLAGKKLAHTDWLFPSTIDAPLADFDGDGWEELVLGSPYPTLLKRDQESKALQVYGKDGKLAWRWNHDYHPWFMRLADTNANGSMELLISSGGEIDALEGKSTVLKLDITGQSEPFFEPYAAGDWTGDGRADLFYGDAEVGILDMATHKVQSLAYPPPYKKSQVHIDNTFNKSVICKDFLPAAGNELLILPGVDVTASALLIYGHPGQLEYYEEFGEPLKDIYIVKGPKGQHLLVLTDSRILVYP